MRIWKRPSLYLAVVPVVGMIAADLLHRAMGCGYECSGPISGPVDRWALSVVYLFGYGIILFWGAAVVSFVIEQIVKKHRNKTAV